MHSLRKFSKRPLCCLTDSLNSILQYPLLLAGGIVFLYFYRVPKITMERIYIRVAVILALTAGDGFSRPGVDAAEFQNVGVAQPRQLFGGLLAPVAAAAIDQDQLIFVRQRRNF